MTSTHCHRHTWDIAEATCRACKLGYCENCLVRTGRSEEPICVPCALAIAGVRKSGQPRMGRKQRRALEREAKVAAEQPAAGEVHEAQARNWAAMQSNQLDAGTA